MLSIILILQNQLIFQIVRKKPVVFRPPDDWLDYALRNHQIIERGFDAFRFFDSEAIAAVCTDVNAADIPILVNTYKNNGFVVVFFLVGQNDAFSANRVLQTESCKFCDLRQMGNIFALVVFTDVSETVNDLICTVAAVSGSVGFIYRIGGQHTAQPFRLPLGKGEAHQPEIVIKVFYYPVFVLADGCIRGDHADPADDRTDFNVIPEVLGNLIKRVVELQFAIHSIRKTADKSILFLIADLNRTNAEARDLRLEGYVRIVIILFAVLIIADQVVCQEGQRYQRAVDYAPFLSLLIGGDSFVILFFRGVVVYFKAGRDKLKCEPVVFEKTGEHVRCDDINRKYAAVIRAAAHHQDAFRFRPVFR